MIGVGPGHAASRAWGSSRHRWQSPAAMHVVLMCANIGRSRRANYGATKTPVPGIPGTRPSVLATSKKPPVLISGFGAQKTFSPSAISNFDFDLWYPTLHTAGEQARRMAGVSHADIDALMCYDNLNPTVPFSPEGALSARRGGALCRKWRAEAQRQSAGQYRRQPFVEFLCAGLDVERAGDAPVARRMRRAQVYDCEIVQYVPATPRTRAIIYSRG